MASGKGCGESEVFGRFCQLPRPGASRCSGFGASRLRGFHETGRDCCLVHVVKAPRRSEYELTHVRSATKKAPKLAEQGVPVLVCSSLFFDPEGSRPRA